MNFKIQLSSLFTISVQTVSVVRTLLFVSVVYHSFFRHSLDSFVHYFLLSVYHYYKKYVVIKTEQLNFAQLCYNCSLVICSLLYKFPTFHFINFSFHLIQIFFSLLWINYFKEIICTILFTLNFVYLFEQLYLIYERKKNVKSNNECRKFVY